MKTILVPTDFSANADHALHYAIEINKKLKAKIVLFHSVFVPLYATDVPIAMPSDEELRREAHKTLNEIKDRESRKHRNMLFYSRTSSGFTENEVVTAEKSTKATYVVMGTGGATGLKEIFLGTNTAAVIEKSHCPVITVPEMAALALPKKIVFATDFGTKDFQNILSLIEFARLFKANVYLLHVSTGDKDRNDEYGKLKALSEKVTTESLYPNIHYRLLDAMEVYEALSSYLEELKADMIAISKRDLRFKLFSRSLTKKMAYHTHIPLMVFHTSNEQTS
jgi:nucleotide-binding universal stress UspA family protein